MTTKGMTFRTPEQKEETRQKSLAYMRGWYRRNREKENIKARAWRRKNPDKVRAMRARYLAKPGVKEHILERTRKYRSVPETRQMLRNRLRLRRASVGLEWVLAKLEEQNHRCAICLTEITEASAHVDHDHNTASGLNCGPAAVRGLLCGLCNQGLGHFKDNAEVMRRAADYVESFRSAALNGLLMLRACLETQSKV